jgi:PadR family transcriptional regulator, regulatory protein AphA
MSLEYAILGFLSYKPFTGYELKKVFDNSIQHFWPADQSQIYRTLAKLSDRGLVDMEVVAQADRPDRKLYHITPAGQEALLDWIKTPFPEEDSRSAALIQVFFSGKLTDDEIIAKFEDYAAGIRQRLANYRQLPLQSETPSDGPGLQRAAFYWLLTLELGIKSAQLQLEWAESVIQRIRNHEDWLEIPGFTANPSQSCEKEP